MKIFNFRPLVFFAIFLILGIILSTYYFAGVVSLALYIIGLALCGGLIIVSLVLSILYRNRYVISRFFKRIIFCIIAIVVGITCVSIKNNVLDKTHVFTETYDVHARICAVPMYYDDTDTQTLLVDDVIIELGTRTYYLKGKTKVYVSSDFVLNTIGIGNIVEFKGRVKSYKITDESEISRDFYNLANDIYYSASVKSDIIVSDETKVSVFENIKINAKEIMDNKFPSYITSIGYGMLFGDDEYIDEDIKLIYNNAGISHLLAVSGLHVGFVVILLSFIFRLFKMKEKTSSIILIIILFMYVIICGFATSVVRAFIMTSCMLISKMMRKSYDSLSSLAFACILILLFSPLDLFTVGFQLSFMAVLGIILLSSVLMNFFSKFLFEQFASSLSISLSASLGIMPIMMISFEKFSVLSVFTNMIVVPVASIGFMILFFGILVSMIIPALSILIVPFETIMNFVTIIAEVASNISINMITINVSSSIIFFWLAIFAIFSEYFRIKTWIKCTLVSLLTIITILIMLL